MKRMPITATILLTLFGFNSEEGFAQSAHTNGVLDWHPLNSGTTQGIAAVHFPNARTGYAVGNNGIVLKTTDAGNEWDSLISPTGDHFWGVYFINSDTGCAVGGISHERFMIYKTTDGGNSWEQKRAGTGNTLTDVYFVGAIIGYAVGGGVNGDIMIFKTTDGGDTWIPRNFKATDFEDLFLSEAYFINAATGYAVGNEYQGGKSIILKTTNGGENWIPEIRNEYALSSVYFADTSTGYIVGQEGMILKTTDAGSKWDSLNSRTREHLFSVVFTDANTGYAVGGSSYQNAIILETTNGGMDWNLGYSATGYQLADVFFTDANTGYAVGSGGTVLKKDLVSSAITNLIADVSTYRLAQNYPNPFNPTTTIPYSLAEPGLIQLEIFDFLGQKVRSLVNKAQAPGDYQISWDGRDDRGRQVPSGLYLYRLQAGSFVQSYKMILMR